MEYAFGLILHVALFVLLIVAAYTDITRSKVYNWTTLPAIGLGLALSYLAGGVAESQGLNLMDSLLGLGVGGGIFFLASLWGGIGFGDVKLMGAVGALGGMHFAFHSLFWSTLAGFVLAVGFLIWQERFWEGLRSSLRFALTLRGRREVRERMAGAGRADGEGESPPSGRDGASGEVAAPCPGDAGHAGGGPADRAGEEPSDDGGADAQEEAPLRKDTIPFGAAIAAGTMVAWFLQNNPAGL